MSVVRKFFSLVVFLVCGWQLYLYGISDINSRLLWKGEDLPLLKYQDNPERLSSNALVFQAQSIASASPERSEELAIAAFRQDPSSGRAATHLLNLYEAQGREDEADQIAGLAGRLWPSHVYTRSNLADYWWKRKKPEKYIHEWNVLLTRTGGTHRKVLFPVMKLMVENDELFSHLLPFALSPPVWWDSFFAYLSSHLELDRLEQLYRLRMSSGEPPPSQSERNSYVRRLIKEKRWEGAYDTWFIGLTRRQMSYGGYIYDGGFEGDVFNQSFGWVFSRSKNPRIKPDITYGIKGRKALQITLRKQQPINFRHVSQRVMLSVGEYKLSMRYRTDTLKTTKGLSWRIRCEGGELLAESESVSGSNPWSPLNVNFTVPKSCPVQLLRLEATSRFRHDHFFAGNIWFDDVQIVKILEKAGD